MKNIEGIGDKTFEKMKDQITVWYQKFWNLLYYRYSIYDKMNHILSDLKGEWDMDLVLNTLMNLGLSLLFGAVGILVLVIGYKIFDAIIPADFNKELEKGNIAVAIFLAGALIGIAIIVSQVVK